jgi:electron transfer flavoprotein alpha subunit
LVASLYGLDDEQKSVWVFLEQIEGEVERVSFEILSKGRQLADEAGWSLVGLLLGFQVLDQVERAIAYGADEVWLADRLLLEDFTVDAYAHVVEQALMKGRPSVFLCGATPNGRDLAGRLAVRLRTGLNADCTDLRLDPKNGLLTSEVTGFGGGVLALLESSQHRPQMSTVRPGVFPLGEEDPNREGTVHEMEFDLSEGLIHTKLVQRVVGEGVDLTQTPVLVCGGRGIEGKFGILRELADLMNGDVGATRPPVDEGQIERERQVGQTGVVCRPKVAFACGISGAFHFVVGIQDADIVVAINSDPNATIFEYADFCIVDDALQFVPALIEAIRMERATEND